MKKILILLTAILFLTSANIFAAKVTGTNTSGNGAYDTPINNLVTELNASDSPIAFIGGNDDLARGFADSTKFMSSTATLNSFINYKLFAVTVGFGSGLVIPADVELTALQDELEDDGDIYAGAAGTFALNAGINTGLLVKNTYVNVLLGGMPETEFEDFSASQKIFGLNVSYSLFKPLGIGLFKWRGLVAGAGFYYAASEISYAIDIGEVENNGVAAEPDGDFVSTIETYKIPIEISTAFQTLWIFNLGLGTGVDIAWGTSDIDVDVETDIYDDGTGTKIGELKLTDADSSSSPTVFQPKVMASIGFNFGPVKIDMPFVYYPGEDSQGMFFGLTAGVVL